MRMQDGTAGFFRHRALVLVAAGGAVAEAGLLTLIAPAARAVAPQVTALPALSAYHDLRWLFTDGQSWPVFALVVVAVLLARSGLDTLLFRLAWPIQEASQETEVGQRARPRSGRVFWSCLALTLLAWVLLSPVATLAFGVAVLPFSWPFIAALPIMIGMLLALSHGGILTAWWRRLPPPRAVGWLLASFAALSAAAAVTARLNTGPLDTLEALGVAAAAGLVNARAWYGVAGVAARLHPREHVSVPAKVLLSFPYAPLAAVMVLALVIGFARLMFTGTIKFSVATSATVAVAGNPLTVTGHTGASGAGLSGTGAAARSGTAGAGAKDHAVADPVLVVAGWGSSCCNAGNGLRSVMPGTTVRQFSYIGLRRDGQPLPSGPDADDIPLPELGDRMAAQVTALHAATRRPVDVVAESEGTLGVYAMLDRHPDLPVGSVALLSPIIQPGQVGATSGGGLPVPEYALDELNGLVGSMSPYGPGGAAQLLTSAGEFGADYFDHMVSSVGAGARWLAVVPLADALTLSSCGLPASPNVVVVPAFHGGLLGDANVLPMVARFLGGRPAAAPVPEQDSLRTEAELISGAAAAWRMPQTSPACP
jgi:hypothetical protein